jgi:hypothetical protein
MLNYKLLQLDLNQLTDEELECYLILKKAVQRIGIQVGEETAEQNDDGEGLPKPEYM